MKKIMDIFIMVCFLTAFIPSVLAVEATSDTVTITRVDFYYANPILDTTITGLNTVGTFNPTEGYTSFLSLSPKNYYIPDGVLNWIRVYGDYDLGSGRGSGSTYWDYQTSSISGTSITGNIYITFYFDYVYSNDNYAASSVVISAR